MARSIWAGMPHIQDLQQNGVKTNKLVFCNKQRNRINEFFC